MRLSGTNLERAADHNQRIALHAIRVSGSLTRIELANMIGLTPPTIANISKRLLAEGLIEEAGRQLGRRGQPPTNLVINSNACFAIGVNIDRDHITVVLVNFAGETIARASREVDFALPDEVQDFYRREVVDLISTSGIDAARIVGVGVASPDDLGAVDLPGRPSAYAEWDEIDLEEFFAEPLGLPIFVENDAAAAAMGEMQLGRGQRRSSFFYILISAGLGGGLVVDGTYFRGANGRSGELGFFVADDGSGGRRQIQHVVSLSGLAPRLRAAGFDIARMLASTSEDEKVDLVVNRWIADAAALLCEPMIAVSCLIDPAAVFIGGRLPARFVDRLAERVNELLAERGENVPVLAPVERAMLADDAPAVGAAILPFSHFLLPKPAALWKAASQPARAAV